MIYSTENISNWILKKLFGDIKKPQGIRVGIIVFTPYPPPLEK